MSETVKFSPLTDADISAARRRGQEADVSEARAVAVRYDRASEQLILTLRGGMTLLIPVHLLQGVAGAPEELIEEVTLTPRGAGLHWETLDADFSVQGLVAGSFGNAVWMAKLREQGLLDKASLARLDLVERLRTVNAPTATEMGRKGGRARTQVKATASSQNTRKSGRPRKLARAA